MAPKEAKENPDRSRDNYNGWVSKYRENKFPYTILEIIFANQKIFIKNFINIFYLLVDKETIFFDENFELMKH